MLVKSSGQNANQLRKTGREVHGFVSYCIHSGLTSNNILFILKRRWYENIKNTYQELIQHRHQNPQVVIWETVSNGITGALAASSRGKFSFRKYIENSKLRKEILDMVNKPFSGKKGKKQGCIRFYNHLLSFFLSLQQSCLIILYSATQSRFSKCKI